MHLVCKISVYSFNWSVSVSMYLFSSCVSPYLIRMNWYQLYFLLHPSPVSEATTALMLAVCFPFDWVK